MRIMHLYHAGFAVIESPDIHFGRVNADFGQGFYLSDSRAFAMRWARERKGQTTYLNEYALDVTDLKIKHFARDEEWFHYIYRNRNGYKDAYPAYDVIIGPIANDTMYDIWGITTSGLLSRQQALEILTIGPCYEQIVIKTKTAAAHLRFMGASALEHADIVAHRAVVAEEESDYQALVSEKLGAIADILE